MHRALFLIVTALGEVATGIALLALPSAPLGLLLGVERGSPEVIFVARVAGAALLAIGAACWLGRNDRGSPTQVGLLTGLLIYDLLAAGLLAYAAFFLSLSGVALWPAVLIHAALAVWCVLCFRCLTHERGTGTPETGA